MIPDPSAGRQISGLFPPPTPLQQTYSPATMAPIAQKSGPDMRQHAGPWVYRPGEGRARVARDLVTARRSRTSMGKFTSGQSGCKAGHVHRARRAGRSRL